MGYTADHACKPGKCRVYGIYMVRMVYMWYVWCIYGTFGAACTECGKGYKIVITKSEKICAACTECGGTDHDPGSKMLQR